MLVFKTRVNEVGSCFLEKKKFLFYLLERQSCKKREGETEVFHLLVHSQVVRMAGAGTDGSQGPGGSSGSPMCVRGPRHLGHSLLLSQAISREVDQK